MVFLRYKKICVTVILVLSIFVLQGVAQQKAQEEEKAENLKVLNKHMSAEDLHALMRVYAKSLGVRCKHCHAPSKTNPEKLDLASDDNPNKNIARKMIKMTADLNRKYIAKIGDHKFEEIACVSCHMGHLKPTISVDSLAKN